MADAEMRQRAIGAVVVSDSTLVEACRSLGVCGPDFCGGEGEPITCRFCARLDIEDPCLLDPCWADPEVDGSPPAPCRAHHYGHPLECENDHCEATP